jgi:hypothetical protein
VWNARSAYPNWPWQHALTGMQIETETRSGVSGFEAVAKEDGNGARALLIFARHYLFFSSRLLLAAYYVVMTSTPSSILSFVRPVRSLICLSTSECALALHGT